MCIQIGSCEKLLSASVEISLKAVRLSKLYSTRKARLFLTTMALYSEVSAKPGVCMYLYEEAPCLAAVTPAAKQGASSYRWQGCSDHDGLRSGDFGRTGSFFTFNTGGKAVLTTTALDPAIISRKWSKKDAFGQRHQHSRSTNGAHSLPRV